MAKLLLAGLIGLALIAPSAVSAQVLINEIAWMGTTVSANSEWLELYNTDNQPVSLDGWQLKAVDGSPAVSLTGSIAAKGYFLLERTGDETVPGISADQIYSGSLANTGEDLQLLDQAGNLIDQALFAGAWPGGDNVTKQTLERVSQQDWATSLLPNGTSRVQNSTVQTEPEEPPTPECPPILQCPEIPECPPVLQCPPVPECPPLPDLNAAIEAATGELANITDGQKIIIHGLIAKRPLFYFGHVLMVDNLNILILGNQVPWLRLKTNIEATGRLLQTPLGPILVVYQASDIKAAN